MGDPLARECFEPTIEFSIDRIEMPLLIIDLPDHLKNYKDMHRWLLRVCPNEDTGCWHWMGYTDKDGYGKYCFREKDTKIDGRAHKFGYENLIAKVPDGMVLDHLCRIKDCVNPWHLEVVEPIVNFRRGRANTRNPKIAVINRAKTKCPHGHEYSGWNLIILKSGSRMCRKCTYKRSRAYKKHNRKSSQRNRMETV